MNTILEKLNFNLTIYTKIDDTSYLLSLNKTLSNNEYLLISKKIDKNNITILSFSHILLENNNIFFNEYNTVNSFSLNVTNDEELDFFIDDFSSLINSYIKDQQSEFDYAIDGNPEKRITLLKHTSKVKNLKIVDLQKELDTFNNSIKPLMIEEVRRKGFEINTEIQLKEDSKNINLRCNKPYYIVSMETIFNKPNHNSSRTNSFIPYIHFKVGRIDKDGVKNPRTIGTDNDFRRNHSDSFFKIKNIVKEKFASNNIDINTNITTYFINDKDFQDIKIFKHQSLTYSSAYDSAIYRIHKEIRKIFPNIEQKMLKNQVFEIHFNDNVYLYNNLDTNKRFIINKKNIQKIKNLIKQHSPYILKLDSDYKKLSFDKEVKNNKLFVNLLTETYINQIKLYSKQVK